MAWEKQNCHSNLIVNHHNHYIQFDSIQFRKNNINKNKTKQEKLQIRLNQIGLFPSSTTWTRFNLSSQDWVICCWPIHSAIRAKSINTVVVVVFVKRVNKSEKIQLKTNWETKQKNHSMESDWEVSTTTANIHNQIQRLANYPGNISSSSLHKLHNVNYE